MAIKISGETIIDDGRVIVDADKIGIGTTNPHVALEIFSGDVGIGTTDPNAEVLNTNTSKLAVGILTANQIFGPITGALNPTGSIIIDENLTVNGNTTLGNASGDALTVNATPTFKENATFEKNVSIGGTLTYEDVTNVDSIGLITARNGIHVLGVGVSVAGFSTFFNTVEFQDKVGIGTDTPQQKLDVIGGNIRVGKTSNGQFIGENSSGEEKIKLDTSGVSFINGGQLVVGGTTSQVSDAVTLMSDGEVTAAGFYFSNNIGSPMNTDGFRRHTTGTICIDTASEERLRIDSDGKVGIGTDNPEQKLEVFDATQGVIRIRGGGDGSNTSRKADLSLFASGAREYIVRADASDSAFKIIDASDSNAERFHITSDGKVGIGSESPGGVLDLYHATNNTILNVKSGDSGSVINLIDNATRSSIEQNGISLKIISDTDDAYANSDIRLQVDGGTVMMLDHDGHVGIGTVSPDTKLHIAGGSNENITLKLEPGGTAGNYSELVLGRTSSAPAVQTTPVVKGGVAIEASGVPGILFGSENTNLPCVVVQTPNSDNGHIVFKPKGSEKVRIHSGGNISIGTTIANERVNIHTASSLKAQVQFTNTTTGTAAGDGLVFGITGSEDAIIWNQENTHIQFATNNTERLRITSGGDVGIGTTDPTGTNAVGIGNTAVLAVGIITARKIFADIEGGFTNTGNVTIDGNLNVKGNVDLGDESGDKISFLGKVDSNILPDGTRNLGDNSNNWSNVHATTFIGALTGNADSATYADNAGIATNIKGGSAGSIPYQEGVDTTTFLDINEGKFLKADATAPVWVDLPTTIAYADNAGIATYADNAGIATYADNAGIATYADNAGIATYADNAGIATYADNAGIATNIKGGSAGSIPYQNGTDSTFFLGIDEGKFLKSGSSAPEWVSLPTNQDTTGTAGGLTGTPDIEVTNIVGAAATFSGITTVTGGTLFTNQLSVAGVVTATDYFGIFKGTLNDDVAAKKVQIASDNGGSGAKNMVFTSSSSGNVQIQVDNSDGVTYQPSTGTISAQQFVAGNASGLSTFAGITTVTGETLFAKQISVAGVVTATKFVGSAAGLTNFPSLNQNTTGNADTATDLAINATQQLVIQTANNATSTLSNGTANYILTSAGANNAPTWEENFNGNAATATTATKVKTSQSSSSSAQYITFVDSNNGTATAENLFTDAGITYVPSSNNLTINGDLTVNGELAYEDVTNVDSIGVITARNGIHVTSGGIDVDAGGINVDAGISTFTGINVDGSGGVPLIESATKLHLRTASNNNVVIGSTDLDFGSQEVVNSTNTTVLNVGIVTANEYYGTFKGEIDAGSLDGGIEHRGALDIFSTRNAYGGELTSPQDSSSNEFDDYHLIIRDSSNDSGNDNGKSIGIGFQHSTAVPKNIGGAILFSREGSFSKGDFIFTTKGSPSDTVKPKQRLRIDHLGRLIVGLGTDPAESTIVAKGNSTSATSYSVLDMRRGEAADSVGDVLGYIRFSDDNIPSSNNNYALIYAAVDAASSGQGDNPGRLVFATTADGASGPTERLRIRSTGAISAKRSTGASLELLRNNATTGTTDVLGEIIFGSTDWDSSVASIISYQDGAKDKGSLTFHTQASIGPGIQERLRITSDGDVGIGTDDPTGTNAVNGNTATLAVGTLKANTITGNLTAASSFVVENKTQNYPIVSGDAGKFITINSSSYKFTINGSTGFSAGETVTLHNKSSGNVTIERTGSGVSLRFSGSALEGDRELTQRGIATIICIASNEYIISGSGLI